MSTEEVSVMMIFWFLHLVPAAGIATPIWFLGKSRVRWFKWEYSILVVPYTLWAILLLYDSTDKTLANVNAEALALGLVVPMVPMVRLAIGQRVSPRAVALVGILAVSMVGVLLWKFTPRLPE